MKIVIAGGSGFLGRALSSRLAERGDIVVILTRRARSASTDERIRHVSWAPGSDSAPSNWEAELDGADAVVNLSGAGLADRRWTAARKRVLRSSRVEPTRALVAAVERASRRPAVFIQGSAIGYYGSDLDDAAVDESSPAGNDYLGRLCVEWEAAAQPAGAHGCRLVLFRTSLVLAKEGGVLPQMARPFHFFVGGRVASGRQVISWIHRNDWLAMVLWALENITVTGVVNSCAPGPVTNAEFSQAVGSVLRRPNWIPAPEFALRMLFGELADALLIRGKRVVPTRTQQLGFSFEFPDLEGALSDIYSR